MVATTEALIQKTPNLMGGEACIRRTRIAVWGLIDLKRSGFSDERILSNFEVLTQEDLDAAWTYFIEHTKEIEDAIRRNEEA